MDGRRLREVDPRERELERDGLYERDDEREEGRGDTERCGIEDERESEREGEREMEREERCGVAERDAPRL